LVESLLAWIIRPLEAVSALVVVFLTIVAAIMPLPGLVSRQNGQ
jgi:hypothetical protein